MYDLDDLIITYAEYHEIDEEEAYDMYYNDRISKKELLEAYLLNEGIIGYTDTIWSIFEQLK